MTKLLADLQVAEPRKVPGILHQLQRLRVTIMTLEEILTRTVNPDLHREIALLSKVQDLGALDDEDEQAAQQQVMDASAALATKGITPESAARIARILSSAAAGVPIAGGAETMAPVGADLEPDPDFTDDPDDGD